MRVRRTLAALCATVPLTLVATACSDSSAGTVSGTHNGRTQNVANPAQDKCHPFAAPGVDSVTNKTGIDIRLHQDSSCTDPTGTPSYYLPTTFSATTGTGQPLWRSFTTVGWPPPVSPD
jgi:hypothetical protein